jgi:hypothetical protein
MSTNLCRHGSKCYTNPVHATETTTQMPVASGSKHWLHDLVKQHPHGCCVSFVGSQTLQAVPGCVQVIMHKPCAWWNNIEVCRQSHLHYELADLLEKPSCDVGSFVESYRLCRLYLAVSRSCTNPVHAGSAQKSADSCTCTL